MSDDQWLLRPARVAQLLDIGRSTVYEMMASGKLSYVRVGKGESGKRIPRSDVERLIADGIAQSRVEQGLAAPVLQLSSLTARRKMQS